MELGAPAFQVRSAESGPGNRRFYILLTIPTLIVSGLTALVPIILIIIDSFRDKKGAFTISQYLKTFQDDYFISSLAYTLAMSLGVTIVSIVISFPLAYIFARNKRIRNLLQGIVTIPRMLPFFVTGYSMILLLAPFTGLINVVFHQQLGILKQPLFILFDWQGLAIALTHSRSVMSVAMLTGVIQEIDPSLEAAAMSMGASRFTAFRRIVFPLTIPGVVATAALGFSETVAAFSVPLMLSGKGLPMVSLLLRTQLLFIQDWNLAFAQAVVVAALSIGCTMIAQIALERVNKKE